jgi:transposase
MELQDNERANEWILEGDWFSYAPVPALFEDETVNSWCARFHRLNGSYESRVTSRVLFGHPKAGLRHDIPGHMGAFQLKTQGVLGDSRNLLRNRTLFCFHSPFLPTELEDVLLNQLISGDSTLVRKQLGLERSGLPVAAPLKFCPECVVQQVKSCGISWWQTSQQLPTAFLCRTHGEWLCNSVAKQYRGVFVDFQTPLECFQSLEPLRQYLPPNDPGQLVSLAKWGDQLLKSAGPRLSDVNLRYCYLLKAKLRGWLSFDGSLRMQKVRDEFVEKYRGILPLLGSDFLGDLDGVNAGFLAYMFRQIPSRRHPLKHVLIMNLLFDSFEDFLEINQKIQDVFASSGESAVENMLCDGQTTLLKLVGVDGLGVSQAAATVGVSVSSAINFLDKIGANNGRRRPHIVGTAKEQILIKMLRQGLDRTKIATTVGVRLAFIKDYLAKQPELKKIWSDAQHLRQIQLHRGQLLQMLKQHSDLPIKSIRRLPNNGFQWLYINDRNWLQEVLPAIWKR